MKLFQVKIRGNSVQGRGYRVCNGLEAAGFDPDKEANVQRYNDSNSEVLEQALSSRSREQKKETNIYGALTVYQVLGNSDTNFVVRLLSRV